MTHYILCVDCPDQPGIVAAVASTLHEVACNIEDAAQFSDAFSGRFFMRIVFRPLAEEDKGGRFAKAFARVAEKFGMTWDIHGERDRVKALVLVSRADHCLNDILYRTRTGHLKLDIVQVVSNHPDCQA